MFALLIMCVTSVCGGNCPARGHFHDRRAASSRTTKQENSHGTLCGSHSAVVPIQHEVGLLAQRWVCSHRLLSSHIKTDSGRRYTASDTADKQ